MTEQIEIKGYWWIPSSPANNVAGILTYTPNESIKLELIGQLKQNISAVEEFIDRKDEEAIFGVSSDAKKISLINCYTSGSSLNFSCKFPIQRYNCQHLVIGTHIKSLDAPHFFKAQINMPYLSLWVTPNSLEVTSLKEDNCEKCTIAFKTESKHIETVDIEDYKLSVEGVVDYCGDYFEPKIKQKTIVKITNKSDFTINDILQKIFFFEQFISFATLKPIESIKITLYDKSNFQQFENGKKYFFPIEYIRVYHGKEDQLEKCPTEISSFLFSYNTIKKEFPTILKKWYSEQIDIAPIRHHLIECVRQKGVFSSIDFLVVIQAIEGFWWRFRDIDYRHKNNVKSNKNTSLNTILQSLITEFNDIERLNLNDINVEEVVDSRHYFSHFVYKSKKPHAKDGLELYHLTKQIRKLLICCLLNFVGFSNEQISRIVKKSNSIFLRD